MILPLLAVVPNVTSLQPQDSKVKLQNGTWGGPHIGLEIADNHSTIEFDCAHGTIDQPFRTDSAGAFDLSGIYVKESAGPARQDSNDEKHPARYSGRIAGKEMTLTVKLVDSGEAVGRFTLTRGALPRVAKCG
jgi:hypothetical protein